MATTETAAASSLDVGTPNGGNDVNGGNRLLHRSCPKKNTRWRGVYEAGWSRLLDPDDVPSVINKMLLASICAMYAAEVTAVQRRVRSVVGRALQGVWVVWVRG